MNETFEALVGRFRDVLYTYRILLALNAANVYKNQPEPHLSYELDIRGKECKVSVPIILEQGVYSGYLVNAICAISGGQDSRKKDKHLGKIFDDLGDNAFKEEYYDPLIQLIDKNSDKEGTGSLRQIRNKMVAHFTGYFGVRATISCDSILPILKQMHSCFLEINDRFNMNNKHIEEIREWKNEIHNLLSEIQS